ncbi:winged helix-turn-helix domain-containing protein [Mobilicoccus caccae]|uniref:winged helix-turn-helix domain-containing protein n=1 Tax=Mobilicoccus caccae TaxID=1859295 RepID=UPI0032AEA0E9
MSLDPSTREVTCDGAPVDLSARETSLLEHLIRAHPRPVSKERLLDDIWAGASADPNVVEAFVGHLRRKIGRERIVTVRGLGYRLAQQDSPDAG